MKARPWVDDLQGVLRFERGVRQRYPEMTVETTRVVRGKGKKGKRGKVHGWLGRRTYRVSVEVPEYGEIRRLTIEVDYMYNPSLHGVRADGPRDSPHRFHPENYLCMWHPKALDGERWVEDDGLLALINHARLHLFREYYYRETGEWAGPEAQHGPAKEMAS